MRIRCPECQHAFRLNQVKPGRYRPRCSQCGKPFLLSISAEQPPQAEISRLPDDASAEFTVNANAALAAQRLASQRPEDGRTADRAARSPASNAPAQQPAPPAAGEPATGEPAAADEPAAAGAGPDASLSDASSAELSPPQQLPGYRIIRMIGRGAMGAVYEARQLSLDRTVALKMILSRWADEPASLARFTREAYAAAQLTHHNVVQIYDFGSQAGKPYFSMEWVRGGSLSETVRKQGALEPRVAAGYILQAARGLQFAHRNGMIHRDIKPANLLLSEDGVVKVADLGLVKLPDQADSALEANGAEPASGFSGSMTEVTLAGSTVGTPAYMPPEQALDAASVDHRADIYSLGCSLYHLLAGKPPFGGAEISRVLAQHKNATPVPLQRVNPRIPEALVRITQRAMAKHVDDRYENIGQMVDDLENVLGQHSDQPFSPSTAQVQRLEQCVADFYRPAMAGVQVPVAVAFYAMCIGLTGLLAWLDWRWACAGPVLAVAATKSYFMAAGWLGGSPVYRQAKQWFATFRWQQWVIAVVAVAAVLAGLWLGGALGIAVLASVVGGVLGAGFYLATEWQLTQQRRPAISAAEQLLRDLRISGVEETKLRRFIARYAGARWEAFFESLFGYQAMRQARRMLQTSGEDAPGKERWPLRDWIIDGLGRRIEAGKRQRDRRRLAKLEQDSLQAAGMNAAQAEAEAWRMAAAMVEASRAALAEAASEASPQARQRDAKVAADIKRAKMKAMLADARSGRYERPASPPVSKVLGTTPRFLLGSLLLLLFFFWAYQNQLLTAETVENVVSGIQDTLPGPAASDTPSDTPSDTSSETPSDPAATPADPGSPLDAAANVPLRPVPLPLVGRWLSGYGCGVAGLLLVLSAGVSSWKMSLFAYPVAAIALCGATLGVPALAGVSAEWISIAIAATLFVVGVFVSYDPAAEYG